MVAPCIDQTRAVSRSHESIQFQIDVLERTLIEGIGVNAGRIVNCGGSQIDRAAAESAPPPQTLAHQSSPHLDPVLLDSLDRAGCSQIRRGLLGHTSIALQRLVGPEKPPRSSELVRAPASDQVHLHTGSGDARIASTSDNPDLIERLEVEESRQSARIDHVGDRDAVDCERRLIGTDAIAHLKRMFGRFVARDVHPVDEHSGNCLKHSPRIAGRGELLKDALVNHDARYRSPDVEQRLLAHHGDALFETGS